MNHALFGLSRVLWRQRTYNRLISWRRFHSLILQRSQRPGTFWSRRDSTSFSQQFSRSFSGDSNVNIEVSTSGFTGNSHVEKESTISYEDSTTDATSLSGDSTNGRTEDGSDEGNEGDDFNSGHFPSIPMGIFGCASLVCAGYGLSHLRDKDEEKLDIFPMLERGMDKIIDGMNSLFPTDDDPLLPDKEQFNYPPNLPTLVVDLDKVVARFEYDRLSGWRMKKRPYADRFFRELANYYEIVMWSDDAFPVATEIANRWGLPVSGVIHRDQCKKFKGSYIKDLSRLGRDLRRVVMLDHDRVACLLQEGNAIIVPEFDGDENDKELLYLLGLLKTIAVNPQDVTLQLKQLGGALDSDLGRRYAEKIMLDSERAKSRQSLSKSLGFKHY